ncbi:MAG TPA: hypothetical protein VF916_03400 [Ktedonobacterales bacterium]
MNERELGVRILSNLSSVREDMLALVDTLWEAINSHDASARNAGNRQIDIVERQVKSVETVSVELAQLLTFRVGLVDEELPGNKPGVPTASTDPIFAGRTAHTIEEDLTSIKPIGFTLEGKAVKNVTHWAEVYVAICRDIAQRDSARFVSLVDNPRFVSARHNLLFSRDRSLFHRPQLVADGVYVEVNLSVKNIFRRLKMLLDEFGIEERELKIYIRQDRDAHGDVA